MEDQMRRVLASTMTACLLGTFLMFDVVAVSPTVPGPDPVAPVRAVVPLTAASAATAAGTLAPTAAAAAEGYVPALLTDRFETQPFSVMGVTWDADSVAATEVLVEARVREQDGWSAWARLQPNDAEPQPGTEEAALADGIASTEPLVTASADAVQVRVATDDGEVPADLEAVVIDPGTSDADGVTDSSTVLVPSGAATGPAIVSRASWGADESLRRCSPSYSSTVLAATVHHTAGSNSYTQAQSAGIVRGIYAYHTGSLGWCDIGYNFLVDKFGTVYEGRYGGRTEAVRGAHTSGFNDKTVGISAMGNYETASAPAAMVSAIGHVAGWKLSLFGRSATGTVSLTSAGGSTSRYAKGALVSLPAVFGHRDVGRTACPGAHLYEQLSAVRTAAAQQTTTATPTTSPTPTASPTPTPTASPTADLRGSVVVPVEVDRTKGPELLAYARTGSGTRHVIDVTVSGRTRTISTSSWTLGWDSVVPIEHDGTAGSEALLYNGRSGRVAVVDTTTTGATPMLLDRTWATGWTHVVPVEVDGTAGSEVLLYNSSTGARRVVEIRQDGSTRTLASGTWATGWTAVTAVEVDRTARSEVSVYNRSTGRHVLVDLGTGSSSTTLASHRWAKGLDTVVAVEADRTAGSELFGYDLETGKGFLTDVATSKGALSPVRSYSWSKGWTGISALEVDGTAGSELLVHNRSTGRMLFLDVAGNGVATQLG